MSVLGSPLRLQRVFSADFLDPLFFLFCLTLHADLLSFTLLGLQFRLNNVIAIVLLAALSFRFRFTLLRFDKALLYALILLFFSILCSFILSPFPKRCFFFLLFYLFTIFAYVFLPFFLIRHFEKERILHLYLASFLVVGLYALVQFILGLIGYPDPFTKQKFFGIYYRPNALCYEPSFYALYFTPFVVLANVFYLSKPGGDFLLFKSLTVSKIILINFLFLISTSTSTIFAYFIFIGCVGLAYLIPLFRKLNPLFFKNLVKFILGLGGAILCLSLFFNDFSREFYLKFFYTGFQTHHSFYERWGGILNACNVFLIHPFFGVGLGGIPPYLMDAFLANDSRFIFHFPKELIDTFSTNYLKLFEPSNVITEIMASLGLVGIFSFAILVGIYIKKGMSSMKKQNSAWLFAFFVSGIVTLVALQFNQGVFRTYIWFHFALSYALFCEGEKNASIC